MQWVDVGFGVRGHCRVKIPIGADRVAGISAKYGLCDFLVGRRGGESRPRNRSCLLRHCLRGAPCLHPHDEQPAGHLRDHHPSHCQVGQPIYAMSLGDTHR